MKTGFYNLKKGRGGFTLIEMLIVIVIIGLLAMIAVSSFGSARKQARLDIALETIMSTMKEQQGKAKTGRQVVDDSTGGQMLCYGLVFQKVVPYVQTITVPYRAIANDNTNNADYCDASVTQPTLKGLAVSEDVILHTIQQGENPVDMLVLLFKPPFGSVLEVNGLTEITEGHGVPAGTQNPVQVFFNQGGTDPQDQRGITYDAFTGTVRKTLLTPPTP